MSITLNATARALVRLTARRNAARVAAGGYAEAGISGEVLRNVAAQTGFSVTELVDAIADREEAEEGFYLEAIGC